MGSDLLKKKKKKEKKEKENLTLPQRPAWLETQCNTFHLGGTLRINLCSSKGGKYFLFQKLLIWLITH